MKLKIDPSADLITVEYEFDGKIGATDYKLSEFKKTTGIAVEIKVNDPV